MLKITSRNEKLNRQMAQKETIYLLHKLFRSFFIHLNKIELARSSRDEETFRQNKNSLPLFRKNQLLQELQHQIFISQWQRYCVHWQAKLLSHSSFTKTRSICFLTGRSRSVYRFFKLSRLKIRSYAAAGHFVGLSKASW